MTQLPRSTAGVMLPAVLRAEDASRRAPQPINAAQCSEIMPQHCCRVRLLDLLLLLPRRLEEITRLH
jgi:hypothetical protein